MELLCRLTDRQWHKGTSSEGDLLLENLQRAIPRFLSSDKSAVNLDVILAEVHDLYPRQEYSSVDLATSQLAQLQSDFGPAGWLMAPLLNAGALLFLCLAFVSQRLGAVARLLALGALWAVMSGAEGSVTTIISSLRDFVVLAVFSEALRLLYRRMSSIAVQHPIHVAPLIKTK